LIYLTFILSTYKLEKHKQSFLSENYEKNSLIKSMKILMQMKSINTLSIVKIIIKFSIMKEQKHIIYYSSAFVEASFVVAP
jgi:hypothetical protein